MKKLQNNFTTPEQSKRLLELGVPADSADLMYDISEIERETYDFPTFVYGRFSRYTDGLYVPCWSVGRLIEIYHICVSSGFSFHVCFPNLMNEIMYKLGEAHRNGWLNLKKLEE